MIVDFSDDLTEETAYKLKRASEYVEAALLNGDVAYQDKPGQVTIIIKKPKKESK